MSLSGPPLQVVATAGHVDHGKSALILRLTGMDPDRLPEEKRRGLTIDLGFAWTTLPSGREVGFVDVPGHERFIRNMLAGVGPARLVLFVVAADEGWKPQSEEHLEIIDVLEVSHAVVAVTKADLVDPDGLARRIEDIRARLLGTRLEAARIVPCSSVTGRGLDDVVAALERMLAEAPPPEQDGRPRQFLDRVFTIRGAGTVVTGTLTGGPLAVGQEAEVLPSAHRARIRGLQTHRRSLEVARPVSRVAVNLAGTARTDLERGDVLVLPGQWQQTSVFDAAIRPVRGLDHPLTSRGAYKIYAGSAERDARIRFAEDPPQVAPGASAFARISMRRPLVLDFHEPFVVREAGRRATVAGGVVLDVDPPRHRTPEDAGRLARRLESDRASLPALILAERGATRASAILRLSGLHPEPSSDGAVHVGGWVMLPGWVAKVAERLSGRLASFHAEHPLAPGMEVAEARALMASILGERADPGLGDAVLDHLAQSGRIARRGTAVRLPEHSASTAGRDDADELVTVVSESWPSPPTVRELVEAGYGRELIRAACADGRLVQVSADVLVSPQILQSAQEIVRRNAAPPGLTVSSFREAMGTSRKYALPILEYFDGKGLTRRVGDVRLLRRPG